MELEKKVGRFGDQINFKELYRIKGEKGLFCKGAKEHKSGMILMLKFFSPKKKMTPKRNIICLDGIRYQTEMGFNDVTVSEVFSNLLEFYEGEVFEADNKAVPTLGVFVPNYDPNEFKEKQAIQVLEWFDEVITKMSQLDGVKKEDKKED